MLRGLMLAVCLCCACEKEPPNGATTKKLTPSSAQFNARVVADTASSKAQPSKRNASKMRVRRAPRLNVPRKIPVAPTTQSGPKPVQIAKVPALEAPVIKKKPVKKNLGAPKRKVVSKAPNTAAAELDYMLQMLSGPGDDENQNGFIGHSPGGNLSNPRQDATGDDSATVSSVVRIE